MSEMSSGEHSATDDGSQLAKDLSELVWFRLALALVPASMVLGASHPKLERVMRRILEEVETDIAAHVSMYDVRKRENDE